MEPSTSSTVGNQLPALDRPSDQACSYESGPIMKTTKIPALLIAAALLFGACGSDDSTDAADAGSTTTSPPTSISTTTSTDDEGPGWIETTRLWIKPELADCVGVAPQKCMQVAESADGDYEFFYDQIVGFDYVEGTSYVIDVAIQPVENPPADGSSLLYTLIEIVE